MNTVRMYTASHLHAVGISCLLKSVKWRLDDINKTQLHNIHDNDFYLFVLAGLSLSNLLNRIRWIQSVSTILKHPVLIIHCGIPPTFLAQLDGCNIILCESTSSIEVMREVIKSWFLADKIGYKNAYKKNKLNSKEWAVLITYLQVKDMLLTAIITERKIKTAYTNRQNAITKLGFLHVNELIRATSVCAKR